MGCDCTQRVSPRTGLEVIFQGHSTVCIVVARLRVCDFNYGGMPIDSGLSGRLRLTLKGSAFFGYHAEFHEVRGLIQRSRNLDLYV